MYSTIITVVFGCVFYIYTFLSVRKMYVNGDVSEKTFVGADAPAGLGEVDSSLSNEGDGNDRPVDPPDRDEYIINQGLEKFLDYIETTGGNDLADPSLETCDYCHRKILSQYIDVFGRAYHREHVSCTQCKRKDPYFRYFELNNRILCADCNQAGACLCAKCNTPIVADSAVEVSGLSWHQECFKCHACNKPLESNAFVLLDKKTYCAARCPKICICASCNLPIYGSAVTSNGVHLHANEYCFSCQTCKLPVDPTFCNFHGLPYCEKHYLEKVGVPICDGCNQAITGKSLLAIGKKWHPEHFVCNFCSKLLATSFQVDKGKPFCLNCPMKLAE